MKRKMMYALAYISLFVALILQTTVVGEFSFFGVSPSPVLAIVVCFALVNDYLPSTVFAVIAGLLLDITGGRIIGFNALIMMYFSLGVVYIGQEFFRETPKSAVMMTVAGTFIYELIFFIFSFVIFGSGHFFYMLLRVVIIECIYNGLIALPIYFYVSKFLRIRRSRSLLD